MICIQPPEIAESMQQWSIVLGVFSKVPRRKRNIFFGGELRGIPFNTMHKQQQRGVHHLPNSHHLCVLLRIESVVRLFDPFVTMGQEIVLVKKVSKHGQEGVGGQDAMQT